MMPTDPKPPEYSTSMIRREIVVLNLKNAAARLDNAARLYQNGHDEEAKRLMAEAAEFLFVAPEAP